MGCCGNCDKGLPCDGKSAGAAGAHQHGVGQTLVHAHPNDPPGAAVWEVIRQPITPMQAAMTGRTMMARIAAGAGAGHRSDVRRHSRNIPTAPARYTHSHKPAVARIHPFALGMGQSGSGCPSGSHLRDPNDPNSECVSDISGKGDSDCSQGQLMDYATGNCADPCPPDANNPAGVRPAGGCPPKTGVPLWWAQRPTWQKAALVLGGVAAVGGGVYLATRKGKRRRHARKTRHGH